MIRSARIHGKKTTASVEPFEHNKPLRKLAMLAKVLSSPNDQCLTNPYPLLLLGAK